jgi:hypothetical protein
MRIIFFLIVGALIFGNSTAVAKSRDRSAMVEDYLGEFCSQTIHRMPKMYTAIKDVLHRMPYKDFLKVTDRKRPVLFTEFYDSGTARFASSAEIIVEDNEKPCCQKGFTIIKLGMALNLAETPEAIEGVIAHELAHRVLDHVKKGKVNCTAEREANALIKQWGFAKEFKQASQIFGQKKGDSASCQE